jgi:hypothetical protein
MIDLIGVVAVLQKLILFEEKQDGDAASGGHLAPVDLRDSDLVERQHHVRLARFFGDVHQFTIFQRPHLNGYLSQWSYQRLITNKQIIQRREVRAEK